MLLIAMAMAVLLVSASHGMTIESTSEPSFEIHQHSANDFLSMNDTPPTMDKREAGKNCVPCKFGVTPCCAPNVCVKKTLRPDECMEIKQGK